MLFKGNYFRVACGFLACVVLFMLWRRWVAEELAKAFIEALINGFKGVEFK